MPINTEPCLEPTQYADETLGFEQFIAGLSVEDTEAALQWHAENYGNNYVQGCLSLWAGTIITAEEKLAERAEALRTAVTEITEKYAKEILWPEFKRGTR